MRALGLSCCVVLLVGLPLNAASIEEKTAFFGRILSVFGGNRGGNESATVKRTKSLTLTLHIAPEPVKLPETRRFKASLDLKNHSKHYVRLEFPSSQRFEALIREKNGNPLVQWSEDESFSQEPGYLIINPGEHLQYVAMLPTRDLEAGRLYEVEFSVPNYPDLSVQRSFIPVD